MLDFKGWEKVGEDKKTTTLKHKNGHVMTLAHTKLPKIQQEHLKRLKFAEGGAVENQDQKPPETNININAAPAPEQNASQQSTAPVVNVPQAKPAQNVLLPNGSMNAPAAAQSAQQGEDLTAQIAAEKGKADAIQQQEYLKERQRINNQDAQHIQELKGHTDEFSNYMKSNPINPKAYLEDMGAGNKITTGLGLLLGGASGGLSGHGGNIALDYLNKQIDRNIDAQKARADQARTIFGAYKDLYGDENIATNLAKVSANDMLVHQAEQTAAKLGTPTAQANLLKLKAQKAIENNKLILDSAGNLSSIPNNPRGGSGNGNSESAVPTESGAVNVQKGPLTDDQVNNLKSSLMGNSANASIPGKVEKPEEVDTILGPNSTNEFKNLAYVPKAKENLGAIQSQYNQAVQADKGLKDIGKTYKNLAVEAEKTGTLGNMRRKFANSMHGLPYGIGDAVAAPLKFVTDTKNNRLYDADKTSLLGYVSSALKGTNVGSGQIQEIVDQNAPEAGDDKETLARKEAIIREFIKNHTDTSLLRTWGLTKK